MININHTQVFGWEAAIRGMRAPMNSWAKSDSFWECSDYDSLNENDIYEYKIGPNDHDLMMRLVKAGDEHAKFMRMIHVSMDILAPLYFWKQADTYKVGFVTNSCSTMHKIQAKEFVLEDFSCEYLGDNDEEPVAVSNPDDTYRHEYTEKYILKLTVEALNNLRDRYNTANERLKTKDLTEAERTHILAQRKYFWYNMIQLLPDSYNQLRTCDTNYATLRKMYHQRKGHKLDEWNDFRAWVEKLPYSELICAEG